MRFAELVQRLRDNIRAGLWVEHIATGAYRRVCAMAVRPGGITLQLYQVIKDADGSNTYHVLPEEVRRAYIPGAGLVE